MGGVGSILGVLCSLLGVKVIEIGTGVQLTSAGCTVSGPSMQKPYPFLYVSKLILNSEFWVSRGGFDLCLPSPSFSDS